MSLTAFREDVALKPEELTAWFAASGWDEQAATELTNRFYADSRANLRVCGGGEATSMTLIADIIHDITANPAPVLFLDTCILLDVVRAPLRSKPDEVRFARLFLASVQKNPKTIHLLVPSPVQPEWDTHIQERVNECTTAVNACNAVAAICGHLALPVVAALPAGVLTMPDCCASCPLTCSPLASPLIMMASLRPVPLIESLPLGIQ